MMTIGAAKAQKGNFRDTVDIEIGDSVTVRLMMKDAQNMRQVVKVDLNAMMRSLNRSMTGLEANMEQFGASMERWGEEFEADMEKISVEIERNDNAAKSSPAIKERRENLERQARELERMARELERQAKDLERQESDGALKNRNSDREESLSQKEISELKEELGAEDVEVKDYGVVKVVTTKKSGEGRKTTVVSGGGRYIDGPYTSGRRYSNSTRTTVTVEGNGSENKVTVDEDGKTTITRTKKPSRTKYEFAIDLGVNNFLQGGKIPDSDQPYNLRPLGSRYVALSLLENTRLGKEESPFYLQWGVEFGFNNFMFSDDQVYIKDGKGGPVFLTDSVRNISKSKFTATYVSLPVMPMLNFAPTKKNGFHIGVGGYLGYRIGSHGKIKYSDGEDGDDKKKKDRSDFHLNSIRYGVMLNTGVEGIMDVFVKYDLNNLFEKSPNPDINVISFGIRI